MRPAEGLAAWESGGELVECSHCTLPVPPGRLREAESDQFCCEGCETVFAVLHDHGLERWYELRGPEGEGQRARTSGRSYEEFDAESFRTMHCRALAGGLLSAELYLEGVHCPACVWLVERLPFVLDGVTGTRLNLGRSSCRVTWDPSRVEASAIARALDRLGYSPHPWRRSEADALRRKEDRRELLRLAVAGAAAGNVMLLSIALYGGWFSGIETAHANLLRWTGLAASLPAVLWAALPFFRGAARSLLARRLHVDLPVALGIAAGFLGSTLATIRGSGEVYFDSVTALVFLLLVGRFLQRRAQRAAIEASDLLSALAPSTAHLLVDGGCRDVPLESLLPGSLVEVRAGESIPVDGRVEDGASELDCSLLTGESRPTAARVGDPVHAGTVNLSSPLRVRAEKTGEETRVGRLMTTVEDRLRRRAPVVQLADRIAGWFVAVVLMLGALTLGLWLAIEPASALDHAVALLIVTCPCALALATPLAVTAALGRAARAGLLLKGGAALERLATPALVLLDKTGTLTEGRVALVSREGDDDALLLAAALERSSSHPVARAFTDAFDAGELDATEVQQELGGGISGRVGDREVAAGSPAWIAARVGSLSEPWPERVDAAAREGLTPVLVAIDRSVAALAGLGDPVRPEAAATIRRLREGGAEVGILSGDHPQVVAAVARAVGVDGARAFGSLSPEEKLARVEDAGRRGTVVMVGDGVNDAAALAAASVGVAVSGGAEASLQAADAFLARPGLDGLADLLEGSRRTFWTIRRGVAFSLAYNLLGGALAMAGFIHPLAAALLMPASSLTVVLIAWKSRSF
jgi:Cu2+-exporting ATPase